jgi:hypothetical protein
LTTGKNKRVKQTHRWGCHASSQYQTMHASISPAAV